MGFIGENLSEERFFPEPLSKDFHTDFSPDIVLMKTKKPVVNLLLEHYIWGKIKPKVLGREFEGDSPQCGEMSHSDRGDRLRQRNPFSKGFPSIMYVRNKENKTLWVYCINSLIGWIAVGLSLFTISSRTSASPS